MITRTTFARPRILLVDDEKKMRESLAMGLRVENWVVVTAADGSAATQLIGAEEFDLVLLDWMLPDTDGMEILRRVRAHAPLVPVIMITARTIRSDCLCALENGATELFEKPFAFADLVARCRALLD